MEHLKKQGLKVGATQLRLDIRQLGHRWQEVLEEVVKRVKCVDLSN